MTTRCWIFVVLVSIASVSGFVRGEEPGKPAELKTFGTAGKELTVLKQGTEAELFKHEGTGCLTHMWFGGDWPGYLKTRIRVYVDGEQNASIRMELGMGVGIGFEDKASPWGIARMGKTGDPSGVYNTFRIPFGKSVRVTGELAEGVKGEPVFWWIIRGTEGLHVQVGGETLPAAARLRLYTHESEPHKRLEEFDLCDSQKSGALFLTVIAAKSEGNLNFLEAQMRGYFDGAREPLMLSSGLEDYFLGTYYFNRGKYYTPVAGLTHLDADNSFSAYRFHDDDPIFFRSGLRLTCRCGEKVGEKTFGDPRPTIYTTYTWVYEW